MTDNSLQCLPHFNCPLTSRLRFELLGLSLMGFSIYGKVLRQGSDDLF